VPNDSERIKKLQQIADGDTPAALITLQFYNADDSLTSPRIIGWCEMSALARAMCSVADEYAKTDVDVVVGYIDGKDATDDDWNELIDYLHTAERETELETVCTLRGMADRMAAAQTARPSWMPDEWEEIALNPDVLECHGGPQPTGAAAEVCETCGGSGQVKHPTIPNYYGDCPDCGVVG
jgi:hypothetical protein